MSNEPAKSIILLVGLSLFLVELVSFGDAKFTIGYFPSAIGGLNPRNCCMVPES